MHIPLIFSVLFFAGGCINTFGEKRNLPEALFGYAIALFLFDAWRFIWQERRKATELCHWLVENQGLIKSGTAKYNGTPIDEQTELSQYLAAMSFSVVSLKIPSRFYIVGHESSFLTALRFVLYSLTIGWWGFPWGPVYTIGSIVTDLKGGQRKRVSEILAELTGLEVVHLTERAAENARRIMAERGFLEGSVMQVEVSGDRGFQQYQITYDDHPPTDESIWWNETHGVKVIVSRKDKEKLDGLIVDFADSDFVFKEGKPKYAFPEI